MKSVTLALLVATGLAGAAFAQSGAPIKLADVAELSGAGATVGTNWKNGIDLAIDEINAKGGVLGRKIEVTHSDLAVQSRRRPRAGAEGARRRALCAPRPGLFRLDQGARRRSPEGRHRRDHGRRGGRPHPGRQRVPVPHLVRPASRRCRRSRTTCRRREGEVGRDRLGQQRFRQGRPRRHQQGFRARGIKVVADLSTESGQADFAADVGKIKAANPDAMFVYLNEEESARILSELRRQNVTAPLIGETTLIGQKVIELAGDAANGARGHVGLTTDAPVPAIQAFRDRFKELQLRAGSQRHQGLSRGLHRQGRYREDGQGRPGRRSPRPCTA